MSRSAFTLIEVLVAIMLISIVVTGMLKIGSTQDKLIKYAISKSKIYDKVSLMIDDIKLQKKDHKKIEFKEYIKNLKLNSKDKKNLQDTFVYTSFIDRTIDDNQSSQGDRDSLTFRIYSQTFRDKQGNTAIYHRLIRE